MTTGPTSGAPSSYQKYKDDTNGFLSWLLREAQASGYKVCFSSTSSRSLPETDKLILSGRPKLLSKMRNSLE